MKKFFLMAIFTIVAFVAKAADLTELNVGYCYGEVITSSGPISYASEGNVSAAIWISPEKAKVYAGNKVSSVHAGLASKVNVDQMTVWVRESLDGENLAENSITTTGDIKLAKGWNTVPLTSAYEIAGDKGFYVGYTIHQKNKTAAISALGGDVEEGAFYLKLGDDASWTTPTDYGVVSIEAIVTGDNLPKNNIQLFSATTCDAMVQGNTLPVSIGIRNLGVNEITSFDVECSVEGIETPYVVTVDGNMEYNTGYNATVYINPDLSGDIDNVKMNVSIVKVNGEADPDPSDNVQNVTFNVYSEGYDHNVLFEEFTTEKCPNCPTGANMLKAVLEYLEALYPERVYAACHHAGYYTDWLTTNADSQYCWFFNSTTTYAPSFMVDRVSYGTDPYGSSPTPVFLTSAYDLLSKAEGRLLSVADAEVKAEATLTADGKINVTVNGECCRDYYKNNPRVTVFVIENNITAKSQSGASGTYIHQHVMRDVNSTWGATVDWNDNKFTYNCEFTLDSSWNKNELEIVAFISKYNSADPNACDIENVTGCSIIDSGVESVASDSVEDEVVNTVYYSTSGTQVAADTEGVVIKVSHLKSGAVKTEKIFNIKK
jgi:hypothetical protein